MGEDCHISLRRSNSNGDNVDSGLHSFSYLYPVQVAKQRWYLVLSKFYLKNCYNKVLISDEIKQDQLLNRPKKYCPNLATSSYEAYRSSHNGSSFAKAKKGRCIESI